jgi:ribosomal protein L11 methyltransferase
MAWLQLEMRLDTLEAERVEMALVQLGALSVTLSDAGDEPVLEPAPGETPLWADTKVSALFDADMDMAALRQALADALDLESLPEHRVESLEDREWEREWLKDFVPLRFGERLWVTPTHMTVPAPDAVVVTLDPGLAFGTGTHATTALCLTWLAGSEPAGKSVLDFGCGSGILAIAAARLGAAGVHAVDIDLQALKATRQNARQNDVGQLISTGSELDAKGSFDIVLGNILASTLIDNATLLCEQLVPGGTLVLSGILSSQVDEVAAAFRDSNAFAAPEFLQEWALLVGTRQ